MASSDSDSKQTADMEPKHALRTFTEKLQVISERLKQVDELLGCNIKVKLKDPSATLPTKAHPYDAGWDLHSSEAALLLPGETKIIQTGLVVEIPKGWVGYIEERSGLGSKGIGRRGGVIDATYRGPVGVILTNHSEKTLEIGVGHRIAQLVVCYLGPQTLSLVSEVSATERSAKGFGSSGV